MRMYPFLFVSIILLIALPRPVAAQYEPLDASSILHIEDGLFYGHVPYCITVDPENRPVLFGEKPTDLAIDYRAFYARGLANGEPDSTLDSDGLVERNICTAEEHALDVVVTSEGKVLGMGNEDSNGYDFDGIFVQRLHPDGAVDSSFSGNGKFIFQLNAGWTMGKGMAIRPDDRIVMSAIGLSGAYNNCVLQLLPDGTFDPDFGTGGAALVGPLNTLQQEPAAICLAPDGAALVTGWVRPYFNAPRALYVMRVLADGSLDSGFGDGGLSTFADEGWDWLPQKIAAGADGSVYVASYRFNDDEDRCIVQHFLADGTYDTSFGVNGIALIPIPGNYTHQTPRGLAVLPSGWLALTASTDKVMVACLFPNGQPVQNFGTNGVFLLEYPFWSDQGRNLDTAAGQNGDVWVSTNAVFGTSSEPVAYKVLIDVSVGTIDQLDGDQATVLLGSPVIGDDPMIAWKLNDRTVMSVDLLAGDGRALGQLWKGPADAGAHQRTFTLPQGLAPGAYLLRMSTTRGSTTIRFVKQ